MLFVDDLSMPQKEQYGAQPPLELLRQWIDHGHWYDLKEMVRQEVVDVVSTYTLILRFYSASTLRTYVVLLFLIPILW